MKKTLHDVSNLPYDSMTKLTRCPICHKTAIIRHYTNGDSMYIHSYIATKLMNEVQKSCYVKKNSFINTCVCCDEKFLSDKKQDVCEPCWDEMTG